MASSMGSIYQLGAMKSSNILKNGVFSHMQGMTVPKTVSTIISGWKKNPAPPKSPTHTVGPQMKDRRHWLRKATIHRFFSYVLTYGVSQPRVNGMPKGQRIANEHWSIIQYFRLKIKTGGPNPAHRKQTVSFGKKSYASATSRC